MSLFVKLTGAGQGFRPYGVDARGAEIIILGVRGKAGFY